MKYLTTKEAATKLNVNITRVQQFITSGRLPAKKFGHVWMIKEHDLAEFAEKPRAVGYPAGRNRI
jgi:excisionase family DNA binding protein